MKCWQPFAVDTLRAQGGSAGTEKSPKGSRQRLRLWGLECSFDQVRAHPHQSGSCSSRDGFPKELGQSVKQLREMKLSFSVSSTEHSFKKFKHNEVQVVSEQAKFCSLSPVAQFAILTV